MPTLRRGRQVLYRTLRDLGNREVNPCEALTFLGNAHLPPLYKPMPPSNCILTPNTLNYILWGER